MAKSEVNTDLWVHDLLNQAEIHLDAQGSTIKELDDALKTASKRGIGSIGYPEYCGIVDDFVIIIEDKANIQQYVAEENRIILDDVHSICNYAVNGALHYGKHIAKNIPDVESFISFNSTNIEEYYICEVLKEDTDKEKELAVCTNTIFYREIRYCLV